MWNYNTNATGYRIIQTGDIPLTDQITISHVLTYGKADKISINNKDKDLMSAVARGQYADKKSENIFRDGNIPFN